MIFHRLARFVLLKFFLPIYERALSFTAGRRLKLLARNSSLQTNSYHFFLSDLDLAIVGDFTEAEVQRLRLRHEAFRKLFLFLGEAEIYMNSEWEIREALVESLRPHADRFRDLRKMQWMVRYLQSSKNPLGRLRAKRGLANCFRRMRVEPYEPGEALDRVFARRSEQLESFIREILLDFRTDHGVAPTSSAANISYYHPWLEMHVNPKGNERGYRLDAQDAALLAALFPVRDYGANTKEIVDDVRTQKPVLDYLKSFSAAEALMMKASVWGSKEVPDWFYANQPDLSHWKAVEARVGESR